ncbi:MAG: hypothetical protein RL595_89 [Planctomycetota bacterium]|jgi:hypothetical protein
MASKKSDHSSEDSLPVTNEHFHYSGADESDLKAWEQVDQGRFMPRRIKGSCKGRALG